MTSGPESPTSHAVVFFCHGSRDPQWRAPFDAIVQAFRAHQPGTPAELAFLELMAPDLPQAIDSLARQGVQSISVLPLFLAPGNHSRRDLPELLRAARQRWPMLQLSAHETLGESAAIRQAIVGWAAATT